MSEPTKKATKRKSGLLMQKPDGLVVDVLPLKELGLLIAKAYAIPSGSYDLVIEYKMGTAPLTVQKDVTIPAIAVSLGGLGLRKSDREGPLTIEVP